MILGYHDLSKVGLSLEKRVYSKTVNFRKRSRFFLKESSFWKITMFIFREVMISMKNHDLGEKS